MIFALTFSYIALLEHLISTTDRLIDQLLLSKVRIWKDLSLAVGGSKLFLPGDVFGFHTQQSASVKLLRVGCAG